MITTAVLNILLQFVNWAVGQLPGVSSTSSISTGVAAASAYVSSIAQVFPVLTLMAIVSFVLVFDGFWIAYQVIRWVYQKIPGIN